jgi:hypothetical protein
MKPVYTYLDVCAFVGWLEFSWVQSGLPSFEGSTVTGTISPESENGVSSRIFGRSNPKAAAITPPSACGTLGPKIR